VFLQNACKLVEMKIYNKNSADVKAPTISVWHLRWNANLFFHCITETPL